MITQTTLHPDISKVIRAFDFLSDTVYTFQGQRRDMDQIQIKDPSNSLNGEGSMSPHQKFINILTTDIYNNLYHADVAHKTNTPLYGRGNFIADISQANHGTGVWEDGWQLLGVQADTGMLIVRKNAMNFWVEKEKVRVLKDTACLVKVAKECRMLNAHFYYAYGNTDKTQLPGYGHGSLRFYWNIYASAAAQYIDAITDILNAHHIHFTTKVLSDVAAYTRTDAAVLYIDYSQLDEVLALVPRIYERVKAGIKTTVPLFVKQLLPGLGFAEDPANGLSFGISRSKLIATTLYDCMQQGFLNHEQWEAPLHIAFESAGISASKPYAGISRIGHYESLINKHTASWK